MDTKSLPVAPPAALASAAPASADTLAADPLAAQIYDVFNLHCPSRAVFDRLGERWTGLVLLALQPGTQRFSELRRQIQGVTQKMLTQTLRALERDGIVARRAYPTVPVTVEYSLTPLGRSLCDVVAVLRLWAYEHIDEIETARAAYTQAETGGTTVSV